MATAFDEYFPFDEGAGSNSMEAQWAEMAKLWRGTGVVHDYLNKLLVHADSTGLQVKVKTGKVVIEGFNGTISAEKTLPMTAAHATLARIDRVVARLGRTSNIIELAVVDGTADASPVAPALTQDATTYEISLATVSRAAGAGSAAITAGQVTDTRTMSWPITNPPSCRVYNVGSNTIANNTWEKIAFDTERWDTDGMHSLVTNSDRLTCITPGEYEFFGSIQWASNATGYREWRVLITNAVSPAEASQSAVSGLVTQQVVSGSYRMAVGDYAELWVRQTSGGNLAVENTPANSPEFGARMVGP